MDLQSFTSLGLFISAAYNFTPQKCLLLFLTYLAREISI